MVGVGLYAAAIMLAVLCALSMTLLYDLEHRLPSRSGVAIAVLSVLTLFDVPSVTLFEGGSQFRSRAL